MLKDPDWRRQIAICHLASVLAGAGAAMLGPLLPVLARTWSLSDAEAGMMPAWEFAGGFCGAIATSRLSATRTLMSQLCAGLGLLTLGLAGAACMSRSWMPLCLFVCGLGLGFMNPAANLIVSRSASPAAALNLFSFSWAAGALAMPFAIALALPRIGPGGVFGGLAICAAVAALAASQNRSGERAAASAAGPLPRAGAFVLITAAALFLYVGVETSMSVWLPTCATRWTAAVEANAAATQSAFWAALLTGRLLAPVWLRHIAPRTLVLAGVLAAAAGIAMVLGGPGYSSLMGGAILAGFGLAPVNPTILAVFTTRLGVDAKRWTGPVFAVSGLGGAAIPWMVGATSSHFTALRAGIAVPLVCLGIMLSLEYSVGRASACGGLQSASEEEG